MRLRHKSWAEEMIASHPKIALEIAAIDGGLPPFSALEIGSGCGGFLLAMAKKNPTVSYLGVEVSRTAFAIAIKKFAAQEDPPVNLRFINCDIGDLLPFIKKGSLDKIFLNFNDPWPKKKHHKRRLTHPLRLATYHSLLALKGQILIKTDNQDYFEDTLLYFQESGGYQVQVYRDYALAPDDVASEYEEKFRLGARPIYRAVADKL